MTITFIGDVHGYLDRLDQVIPQAEGDLLFVGDLVDRGPDVRGVVDRVRGLCDAGRARCIMGNHEYALVRGTGLPELGIEPCPPLFESWYLYYGGDATIHAYGAEPTADSLRAAMGDDLVWMAQLPWVLEGWDDGKRWIAAHAGLSEDPMELQLEDLRNTDMWWLPTAELPMILYAKEWIATRPVDQPDDTWIVNGHVPLEECYIVQGRIACDTSGGLLDRPLSGVIFPDLRVVASEYSSPARP